MKGPDGTRVAPGASLWELLLLLGPVRQGPAGPAMLLKLGENTYASPSLLLPSDHILVAPVGRMELEA